MSRIELSGINKFFGKNHVLQDLNLTIEDGEFMTLLGPSGCGKTTTLRVVAGLEKPQSGTIRLDGKTVVNAEEHFFAPPSKRNLNLVFQSYALWPHMTVFKNVAFGLTVKKLPSDEVRRRVDHALERMQIRPFSERYPSELSGGQQQRVAIARAIVSEPKLLLLDEPLSNLDAKLRIDMRSELKRLHQELGTTVIYVTHDQVEALTMSTKIAIFFDGRLAQVAPPMDVYNNPADLRVADFIGNPRINLITGRARRDGEIVRVRSDLGELIFQVKNFIEVPPADAEFDCALGIRPEQIAITLEAPEKFLTAGKVYSSMPAGSETLVQIQAGNSNLLAKEIGISPYEAAQTVYLNIDPKKINLFDTVSKKLIKKSVNK